MFILDVILLAMVLALAGWRLLAPAWFTWLRVAGVGLAVLVAAAQWALYGYTWQSVPAYVLLALSALPQLQTTGVPRWLGRAGVVAVAAGCVGVWLLPAVPTLPPPDGMYGVGTQIYRWTDPSRDEPHTTDPTDRRSVIAQVWYPTEQRDSPSSEARLDYIDGIGQLPSTVSVLPRFVLNRYHQIDTHAEPLAPLMPRDQPWPVVIFSPGYGAPRAVYTGLVTQLASRGFIVFALDHPYEAAVATLPDGQVVGTREILLPGEIDRLPYMVREQARRTADVRFVIDQLARPQALSPQLDGGVIDGLRIAVVGHSFGGAAAMAAASEDARVVAAANIDGTPYGDLPDHQLARPLLLLQSDYADTQHSEFFLDGNGKLLACATPAGSRFEIKNTNHYSFTDMAFFFAPPGRWLLAQMMGGNRGPAATQQATADILAAFLTGPLTGTTADLAATAARYPGVLGGSVERRADCSDRRLSPLVHR